MSFADKLKLVIKLGQMNKLDDLKVIVDELEVDEIQQICQQRIEQNDINTFFHYLMKGFTNTGESKAKRFQVVFFVLNCCNKDDLTMKDTLDLVTRVCVDLDSFSNDHIIQFVEQCLDSIRQQDSKSVYWKDLLPQLINILFKIPVLDVNGIPMSGVEYRSAIIKNITLFKWRLDILTPLASLFKEIELTKDERERIMTKLCENLFLLPPTELPGLALQLFGLCNTPSLIVIPILFLQKYFNKNYYSREYGNVDSNTTHYDSIDPCPLQELQQVQETILYHLSNSTEFKLNERDVVSVFRHLANTPHYLLTPFMISTLLSLSKVNRQPDVVRLSCSAILPFLRKVIQTNEHEREMGRHSLWCRQTFNRNTVDIDNLVSILIDQSITSSSEVVTPGVVALAFVLLKAKRQPDLNSLGITFLHQFLKKRFIFGQGVMKQLAELLFAHQDQPQYSECLNTLTLTCTLTIAECVPTVESILEFLLLIPGHHAMRMISFVYPLIKMSPPIRDNFIEVLTKAMSQTDPQMRRFGVYGFCLLLKNLRNNNARRAPGGSVSCQNLSFTQGSISGFSLMSQSTLGNRDNPHRHFDMLALEIIGILRKCFNETCETKEILYEGLTRAIEFNYKLTSHLLIFIDWHFRSYFEVDNGALVVRFDRIVKESSNVGEIDIWDNLGKLVAFMATCVSVCEEHHITHDNKIIIDLLNTLLEKCDSVTVQSLNLQNDRKSREIGQQLLHFLEGVMSYAVIVASPTNHTMRRFHAVYKHHEKVAGELKALFTEKRSGSKKQKSAPTTSTPNCTATQEPTQFTLNGATQKEGDEMNFKPVNIWETTTMQKLLNIIFGDLTLSNLEELKRDAGFKTYLLRVVTSHIESYRHLPDYRHVKHSQRMLSFLCATTKVAYKNTKMLYDDESIDFGTASLSLECFRQCLMTSDAVYKKKLENFFVQFTDAAENGFVFHEQVLEVIADIHKIVERSVGEEASHGIPSEFKKNQLNLLQCLEILYYNYLPPEHSECAKVSNWLHTFCLNHTINGKHLDLIFKLLLTQRQKYFDGDYFTSIAMQLSKILGTFSAVGEDEPASTASFELKAITEFTAESVILHLCGVLKQDIDDVECTILKAKSMASKIKFLGERGTDDDHVQSLKTMERSICAHLIHIANALLHLTNGRVPVGTPSDTLVRLLTQYHICLNNVCKHLIARHAVIPVVYGHIKFDKLIQVSGKPLAGRIYDLITYIDQNILAGSAAPEDEEAASSRKRTEAPQKTKKKVIRETRSVPKLIRWIETLHKFVLILGRKTSKDISAYLHLGVVRDFRIQSSEFNENEENSDGDGEEYEENFYDESDGETIETNSSPGGSRGRNVSGTATEKIFKNVARLKRKAATTKKTTVAVAGTSTAKRGKRARPAAVVVPDVTTGILSAINENAGPKSPAKKRARRSARST